MSTLVIDELYPGVVFSQNFKILNDVGLKHIRPWIYVQNTLVDGDLQLEILEGATVLKTVTINYALINAAKDDTFVHGYLRFDLENLVLRIPQGSTEHEYTIRLEMINHTLDTTNYLAVCRQWDHKSYSLYGSGVVGDQAPNDMVEPLGLEFYNLKEI